MSDVLEIKLENLDKIVAAFVRFPRTVAGNLQAAGREAGALVIGQEGLQKYPSMTDANMPPYPYYERGKGTWTSPNNNTGSSERYGTQFTISAQPYITSIGNRATYAPYLGGAKQAQAMAKIGWRKLYDVAKERLGEITRIYQRWVDKTIREVGL